MLDRRTPIAVMVCVGMLASFNLAWADEGGDRTAEQLYEQFMELYEAGEYREALELSRRIDLVQLPADKRERMSRAMIRADRALHEDESPADLLEMARRELEAGRYGRAASRFQEARAHPQATAEQRTEADAGFAAARRAINEQLARAREDIARAEELIRGEDFAAARRLLSDVERRGLDLGRFHRDHLRDLLALIEEREGIAEPEQPQEPVAPPQPDEPLEPRNNDRPRMDNDDLIDLGIAVEPDEPVRPPEPNNDEQLADNDVTEEPDDPVEQPEVVEVDQQPEPEPAPDLLSRARRAEAQEQVVRAREAMRQDRLDAAIEYLEYALQLHPGSEEALALLREARQQQRRRAAPRDPIDVLERDVAIRIQETLADYEQHMVRARRLMREGRYEQARQSVHEARLVLDDEPQLPREQYMRLLDDAVDLNVSIQRRQEHAERVAREEAARVEAIETVRDDEQRRRERTEEINSLVRRADELRRNQRYSEAIELLEQAIFISRHHLGYEDYSLVAFRDTLQDTHVQRQSYDLHKTRGREWQQHQIDHIDATIPWVDIQRYPPDWPQLTKLRLLGEEAVDPEAEADRRAQMRMDNTVVTFTTEGRTFGELVDFFRDRTATAVEEELNIIVDWNELLNEGVMRESEVPPMRLSNIPLSRALTLVLEQLSPEVEWVISDGLVRISTVDALRGRLVLDTHDVRDMIAVPPDFISDAFGMGNGNGAGLFNGGGGGGFGNGFGAGADPFGPDPDDTVADLIDIIQTSVGRFDDWQPGGGEGEIRYRQGTLIVKTTPQNHRGIRDLLAKLREAAAMQIHLETRFLMVTQNFLDEVGLDIDIRIPGTGRWGDVNIAQDSFGMTSRPGAVIPGSWGVTAVADAIGQPGAGNDVNGVNGNAVGVLGLGEFNPATGFAGTGRAFDFNAAYLDDVEVTLLLRASRAHRKAISLSAPRITFFNGQQAFVAIFTEQTYVSNLNVQPGAQGADPEIDEVASGVLLQVQGTISADRRYVTLTLQPRVQRADISRRETIQQPAVGDIAVGPGLFPAMPEAIHEGPGGDDFAMVPGPPPPPPNGNNNNDNDVDPTSPFVLDNQITLPTVEVTELGTTVSVPDRGTLLLGGQRLVEEVEIEAGVPILSKIPILNRLFSNRTMLKDERTLLVLAKPTIIIQAEEEQRLFPDLLRDPRAYVAGMETPNSR